MNCPLVSVVMPCYNNAALLSASVHSVLQQDYPNIELIVVDDGSTDNSIAVLQSFGDKISIIQQKNQGPAAARNTGIQAAKGQFIAFNDSDDIWLPGKLTAQITYLQQHPDTGLCYSGWKVWAGDNATLQSEMLSSKVADAVDQSRTGWLYLSLLKDCVIHTITAVIRRDVFDAVGMFNPAYRIGEDHDLWLRVSQHTKIAKLKAVYALYRDNPHSITKKVHPQNYSLLVLQSALQQFGTRCPSGNSVTSADIHRYLGERSFTYGYQAIGAGQRQLAKTALKSAISHRFILHKSIMLYVICSVPWLYSFYVKKRIKH